MIYINKGEDHTIRHRVVNTQNGAVNLTGASIYAYMRTSASGNTYVFQKRNTAAGGGDSEIEVVGAANGDILIKLDDDSTALLTNRVYYLEIYTTISGADYIQTIIIKVRQNSTNTSASSSTTPRYLTIANGGITGDLDGNNTTFTLSVTPAANTFFLFKNGVKQILTTDYTLTGTTVETVLAPAADDILEGYCDA
jgi:hypothetical protein